MRRKGIFFNFLTCLLTFCGRTCQLLLRKVKCIVLTNAQGDCNNPWPSSVLGNIPGDFKKVHHALGWVLENYFLVKLRNDRPTTLEEVTCFFLSGLKLMQIASFYKSLPWFKQLISSRVICNFPYYKLTVTAVLEICYISFSGKNKSLS